MCGTCRKTGGKAAGCEASTQGGSGSVRTAWRGQSWGAGWPPAQSSRPPAARVFPFFPPVHLPVCLRRAAQPVLSMSALWLRSGPAPHVLPALPWPQASTPQPRGLRAQGLGTKAPAPPQGRGTHRSQMSQLPHPHSLREAITLSAGEEKEATSKHLGTLHQCQGQPKRKGTQGPQGAERAPVGWAGRGAAVSVGGVVAIGRTPRRLRRLRARRGNVVWEDFLEEEEEFQGTWRLGTSFDPSFPPVRR